VKRIRLKYPWLIGAFFLAAGFWLFASILHAVAFGDVVFVSALMGGVAVVTWMRVLGAGLVVSLGILAEIGFAQRRRVERDLQRETGHLRALMDNVPDFIYFKDTSSRFTSLNAALADALGLDDPQAAVGKADGDFVADDTKRQAAASHEDEQELFRSGRAVINVERELRWIGQEEKRIYATTKSPIRDENGTVTGLVGISRDITDRKRAGEWETRNAETLRDSRIKDEFLSNMSHELRTPLNAVIGLSEILGDGLYGELNEKQTRSVKTIHDSGEHLLELITDILDVTKAELDQIEITPEMVDVESVCESALQLVRGPASKGGIHIALTVDPSRPTVAADRQRLLQILANLLSNAVKFTPSGGRVGLETRLIDKMLEFTIWDTGIGIAEEDTARLFQPFSQLDSSLSRRHQGTGLGLALVKRLTELHGGKVSVESEVGEGSRFTVALPLQMGATTAAEDEGPGQSIATPQELEEASSPGTLRVLVVEDNSVNAEMLDDFLRLKGHQTVVVEDGQSALEVLQDKPLDIALVDIQLPGMSGLELIREMRLMPDLRNIRIVAVTAQAMAGDRERCLEAGADDYLAKPIKLRELTSILENLGPEAGDA